MVYSPCRPDGERQRRTMFGRQKKKEKQKQDPRYLISITRAEVFLQDPLQLRQYCSLGYSRQQIAVLLGSFLETALAALYSEKTVQNTADAEHAGVHILMMARTIASAMQYQSECPKEEALTPEECYQAYLAATDQEELLGIMAHAAQQKLGKRIDRKAFADNARNFFRREMRETADAMYREMMVPKEARTAEDFAGIYADAYAERNSGR